jgi:hypothetical protein
MYGTVARMKIKKENLDKMRELMNPRSREVEGYRASYVLVPDNWKDEVWLLAVFDDKPTYLANADSPEQNEEYVKYRALLEADPEWIDGQIESYE